MYSECNTWIAAEKSNYLFEQVPNKLAKTPGPEASSSRSASKRAWVIEENPAEEETEPEQPLVWI